MDVKSSTIRIQFSRLDPCIEDSNNCRGRGLSRFRCWLDRSLIFRADHRIRDALERKSFRNFIKSVREKRTGASEIVKFRQRKQNTRTSTPPPDCQSGYDTTDNNMIKSRGMS